MKDEHNSPWGARIERGCVRGKQTDADGVIRYTVESYDRPGVIATDIPCFFSTDVETDSTVYFFMFNDGNGGIIGTGP